MSRARVRPLLSLALVGVLVSFVATSIASAEEGESRVGNGYVGVGYAYGSQNFDRDRATNEDDASGVTGWLGFRITDLFAVETQFEYQRGFDLTVAPLDGDGGFIVGTLNAKIFPMARVLPSRVEPFLFLGLGAGRVQISLGSSQDIEEVDFLTRAGGGVDVYVVENVALQFSASYVQGTGQLSDYAYTSSVVGVQYSF